MKRLYEIESEYNDTYTRAIEWAEMGCTLKELVEEIGFNNITIFNPHEEDTDTRDIYDIYYGSDNYNNMNDDMKNCKVVLSSLYEDGGGLTCANVVLENSDDWKYFEN